MTYYTDYSKKPIGGGNPYYQCIYCNLSDPEINGRLDGHLKSCEYRKAMLLAGYRDIEPEWFCHRGDCSKGKEKECIRSIKSVACWCPCHSPFEDDETWKSL